MTDLTVIEAAKVVDARAMACPGPLLEAKKSIGGVKVGEILEIWSGGQFLVHYLYGYRSGKVQIHGAIDSPHATLAKLFEQVIVGTYTRRLFRLAEAASLKK